MKAAGLKGMAIVKRRAHANKATAGVNQAASQAAILGAAQFPATAGEGQNPKLETRNPKSEMRPSLNPLGHCRLVKARAVQCQLRRSAMFIATPSPSLQAPEGRNGFARVPTFRPSGAWVVLGWAGL